MAMFDRRTRICVIVILLGLANFLAYTIGYWVIGGEAIHGRVQFADGQATYFLAGRPEPVSRCVFIYSCLHSASIWITFGAVMLSMLTLAKDRIVSSLRSAVLRGKAVITVAAIIIVFVTILTTFLFVHRFVEHMTAQPPATPPISTQAS